MKFINICLFIFSCFCLILVIKAINILTDISPTSIIYISNENKLGNGITFQLPQNLTPRQKYLLNLAYNIAKEHGHNQPRLLQGILLQESNAGNLPSYRVAGHEFGLPVNRRYYGVAQIKLAASKDVMQKFPFLWNKFNFHTRTDEELISRLISDDKFNLTIASKYLILLQSRGFNTLKELALAYNQGPTGAKRFDANSHPYSIRVMRHIQNLHLNRNSNNM